MAVELKHIYWYSWNTTVNCQKIGEQKMCEIKMQQTS